MSPSAILRIVLALGVIALSTYFVATREPRLGLDLSGGTSITLEAQSTDTVEATAENVNRLRDVLERRVNALGVAESTVARSGERRIIVELPGVQDPREAADTIGRTAQLTFHPVQALAQPNQQPRGQNIVLPDEDGQPLLLAPAALTGDGVRGADAVTTQTGAWVVSVDFRGSGADAWAQLTGEAACNPPGDPKRRVAIVLDDQVISSPQVDPSVACGVGIPGGSTEITGNFAADEAADLAALIEGGALPLPVEVIELRTVGATLGDAAIEASFEAGIIGIVLTGLFIIAVYRLMGALATFALASYALISYAALLGIGATLTLPGLAGFVLAVGMAIDANVLVFERAREEYVARRSGGLRKALQIGFNKAWSAILDSNVTTLLAAALLFFLASGPVKGFGVTLTIGVLASMISALIIARALTEWAAAVPFVQKRVRLTGIGYIGRVRHWLEERNPYLLRRAAMWIVVSAAAVLVAVAGIGVRGVELGVEFTGGRIVEYSSTAADPIDPEAAREIVSEAGYPRAVVQASDGGDVTVRTGQISNQEQFEIQQALGALPGDITKERDELIGPTLGAELRRNALIALGVALAAQMLYLAFRFRWTFSVAAVLAMLHDVLIVVGIFAWLGKPIDGVFLAAALSIIGLSVNDTVVVFDRVREVAGRARADRFGELANKACLQTIPRTVNTGLGAMFILAALAILGGDSLKDFAIALLLGLAIGTYSSVFAATPLAIVLQRFAKEPEEGSAEAERRRRKVDPYGASGVRDDSGAVI